MTTASAIYQGITSKLDYLKNLGIDAIWITPFYPSPQKDHGYDVADYFNVNPEYGTLADFSRLVEEAHRRRLKVLVDLVPNHTSDQHPWFQAALSRPNDPHRARYYFADAKPDGSPPNNWESAFSGSAWTEDKRSGQWYLHLFAPEQPDLNWWNPAVPKEFERILKFWLDKGADGYRIDVASALFKRKDMADRPMIKDPTSGRPSPDAKFMIIDQPAGPRCLSRVAPNPQPVPTRTGSGGRDLRALAAEAIHPAGPARHGVRARQGSMERLALERSDRGRPACLTWIDCCA